MGMRFSWDPRKAAVNLKKHGVSFDEASTAFGDPLSITVPDPSPKSLSPRRITVRLLLIGLLTAVAACTGGTGAGSQAAPAELSALDARFNSWVASGQVDSIVTQYYAQDITLLLAGAPAVHGRDGVRAIYDGFYKLGNVRGGIKRTALLVADSIATDVGTYEMRIIDKQDSTKVLATDHGSYITSFVRRDGKWLAIYDSPVSDIPPAPAPATAKKPD